MSDVYFRPDHFKEYPMTLATAEGSTICDVDGREYIDLTAIMGAVSCGHGVASINEKLLSQVGRLWASNLFATDIQMEAISKVDSILPNGINVGAFYSTGAEAIEFSLRLARAITGRNRVLSFRDHFHGKTHGAMQLVQHFPDCYGPVPAAYRTVIDSDGSDPVEKIERCLGAVCANDVAAVIFEPVIGYSGPRRLNPQFLRAVREFCNRNNVIMIADEILTGFHRCNGWFFSCQDDIEPDLIVFGKGLGNGYPISGVACRERYASVLGAALPGSTFAGNSLACAAALGTIEYMQQHEFDTKPAQLEKQFREFFAQPKFAEAGLQLDGLGGLLSISFRESSASMRDVYIEVLRSGVITSHTDRYLRVSPPLNIPLEVFARALEIIGMAIESVLTRENARS